MIVYNMPLWKRGILPKVVTLNPPSPPFTKEGSYFWISSKFGSKMNVTKLMRFFLELLCVSVMVAGCTSTVKVPQWSGSGFLKKEFLGYKKVAVLPFEGDSKGEVSEDFVRAFHEKFPSMELVESKQLLEVFRKEDLYPNRVNEATRRKIRESFGVQALAMGNIYYPSIVRWLLQVQIVDAETNEMLGRSLVEIDFMGAEGAKEACKIAVQYLTPE